MRLVVFDLDGVLVDSKDLHFAALNSALESIRPGSSIEKSEHLARFDGLDTRSKLRKLIELGRIHPEQFESVWSLKQRLTARAFDDLSVDNELVSIFRELKNRDLRRAVASNSIRKTVNTAIGALGLGEFVDFYLGNEDVSSPKPHPEIYWRMMMHFETLPEQTLIVEDSPVGRESARRSGARTLEVANRSQLSIGLLLEMLENKEMQVGAPWSDPELNVVIPMAGAGQRFVDAGYTFPKPLIEVMGMPMIQRVVKNLNVNANFTFIVQAAMSKKYNLPAALQQIAPNCRVVETDGLTQGAAETVLLAASFIDNDRPLLLANSDQLVRWDSGTTIYKWRNSEIDGAILTFPSVHPKWSYAAVNDSGFVERVAEKKPISDNATVGIYFWQRGHDFVRFAKQMMAKDIRTNGEFYVCPVFNELISAGGRVVTEKVEDMFGLGTPEDLHAFLANPAATEMLA